MLFVCLFGIAFTLFVLFAFTFHSGFIFFLLDFHLHFQHALLYLHFQHTLLYLPFPYTHLYRIIMWSNSFEFSLSQCFSIPPWGIDPNSYPQVPLPITLKGYPYPCYSLCWNGGEQTKLTNPVPYIEQVESFGQSQTSQVGSCVNSNSDQSFCSRCDGSQFLQVMHWCLLLATKSNLPGFRSTGQVDFNSCGWMSR